MFLSLLVFMITDNILLKQKMFLKISFCNKKTAIKCCFKVFYKQYCKYLINYKLTINKQNYECDLNQK